MLKAELYTVNVLSKNSSFRGNVIVTTSRSKRVQPTSGWTVAASTQHKLYSLLLPPAMGARFYRFLGRPAKWTRWLAGAAAIKSG